MIFSVFGTPSPLTSFVLHAARAAMRTVVGPHDAITASTVADLEERWTARTMKDVVFFADTPEQRLASVFVKGNASAIVVLDDPFELVGHLTLERQCDIATAIRTASVSLNTTRVVAASRKAVVLTRAEARSPREVLTAIFRAFDFDPTDKFNVALVESLRGTGIDGDAPLDEVLLVLYPTAKQFGYWRASFKPHDQALIEAVLGVFRSPKSANSRIKWPNGLFFLTSEGSIPVEGPIDLTGPARHLIHGPYLSLPLGRWRASINLEIAENISGNVIGCDVCASGKVLANGKARLPAKGKFYANLDFEVAEPRSAIEIRLAIKEGAIEGRLFFNGVELSTTP